LQDLLFCGSRNNAGYEGLDDDFVVLVLEDGFGFGAVGRRRPRFKRRTRGTQFGDGEAAAPAA